MNDVLKAHLVEAARHGQTLTYAELATRLGLRPPQTIHRTTLLLEALMKDQAKSGEPQLASFVVSRARRGLPAPGFFMLLRALELYDGRDDGHEARAFIDNERARCVLHFAH